MWVGIVKVSKPFQLGDNLYKEGDEITVTHGIECDYAAWTNAGIWDLPNEYIDKSSITTLVKGYKPVKSIETVIKL